MGNLNTRTWVGIGFVALTIFALGSLNRGIDGRRPIYKISESYEMNRPKNGYFSPFDLSGREIDRKYIESQKNQISNKIVKSIPAAPSANGKLAQDGKSKIDSKKKAKEDSAKRAAALAEAKRRRAKLSVTMVGQGRTGLSSGETFRQSVPINQQPSQIAYYAAPVAPTIADDDHTEPKLSAGQWLSLLQNQPTAEKAIAFRKAKDYLGNKAYYYDVLVKLLVDSQPDRQAFAYNLLKSDISSATFYFLANPTEELKKHVQIYTKTIALFEQYKNKKQFGILAYALSIENANANMQALSIIKELSSRIQARSPSETPVVANGQISVLKIDDFKVFASAIKKLEKSPIEEIAQNAQSLYSFIWPMATVAGNT